MRLFSATLWMLATAALAHAQHAAERAPLGEETVRPEAWPEAGRWAVEAWVVIALGAVLVLLTLIGMGRWLRRSRSRSRRR